MDNRKRYSQKLKLAQTMKQLECENTSDNIQKQYETLHNLKATYYQLRKNIKPGQSS